MPATFRSCLRTAAPRIVGLSLAVLAALFMPTIRDVQAEDLQVSPNLANQLRYVHIAMQAGRVTAAGSMPGRTLDSSAQTQDRREKLRVDLNGVAPSISYELFAPTVQLTLSLDDGGTLRIRRTPVGDSKSPAVSVDQPAEGRITISVGQGAEAKRYSVDSWWHLYAAEPDFVRNEIEPLLRLLRPGWPVAAGGQEVIDSLYRRVDAERNFDRQAWTKLVERLRGARYVDRVEADRGLRELGQIVVPYLRSLDEKRLDAEQIYRIRMIVRTYNDKIDDDSPEATAQWLAADPEIWYSLAARADAARRTKIRTQLSLILGQPVKLDDDASGETLTKQLAEIRRQLDQIKSAATPTRN